MADGRVTSRELVLQYLTRIALYEDRLNAVITVNPRRARRGRGARPRARRRPCPRAAARHPDRAQGQHPHHRHADHRRRAGVRRPRAAVRGHAHDEPARGRRGHHRQDGADRARQLGGRRADADARQLQRARRLRLNPYDPRRDPREATVDGRPALATGGSSSGIGTAASFWAANVGTETSGSILSPANQNMLVGDQADGRPHQPLRHHPDHRRPGHGRPDGADGHRRGDPARRARGRARPIRTTRPRRRCPPPAGSRLHALLERGRAQGRAHRHPARVLLRQGSRPRATRSRAAASTTRPGASRWTRRSRS